MESTSNKAPLISIVLAVKNGLPYLKNTINSLLNQTYKNFELIIQDGVSTDGTIEYLQTICSKNLFKSFFDSSPDNGIRQAYGRGIKKCQGDIFYFIASDESLFEHSLEDIVSLFNKNPLLEIIYGTLSCLNKRYKEIYKYVPPLFEYSRFLKFKGSFPIAAAFFRKRALLNAINDFPFDEPIIAWDFDLWLRLGEQLLTTQILRCPQSFAQILATRTSSSFRAEVWEQFPQDIGFMLNRFVNYSKTRMQLLDASLPYYQSFLMGFAVRQVLSLEGVSKLARRLVLKQEGLNYAGSSAPYNTEEVYHFPSEQISVKHFSSLKLNYSLHWRIISKIVYFFEWLLYNILSRNFYPIFYKRWIILKSIFYVGFWIIDWIIYYLPKINRKKCIIRGGSNLWGYIAKIDFQDKIVGDPAYKYWIKVQMKVLTGAIGVCLMNGEEIEEERTFVCSSEQVLTYFLMPKTAQVSIIFRNNLEPFSIIEVNEVSIVRAYEHKQELSSLQTCSFF